MKEYKILQCHKRKTGKQTIDIDETEILLNQYAQQGWRVVNSNTTFTSMGVVLEFIVILERDV